MPALMERVTAARTSRPHRRGAMAWSGDILGGIRPYHRSRDQYRRCLQGISPPASLHGRRRPRRAVRPPGRREAKTARCLPERATRCRHHPRSERGSDRSLASQQGYRTAHRTCGARLYRGPARHRPYRSRRLCAAPPDRGTLRTAVAFNHRAAAGPRHRRTIHVLSDPRPDGPRLDLAAQHHARHRPRDGANKRKPNSWTLVLG